MDLRITRTGVYMTGEDGIEAAVPVGTVVSVEGDDIPAGLVNKCAPADDPRFAVTNPAEGAIVENIDELTKDQLAEALKALDLPASGNKDELVARLKAAREGAGE